jgi:uncharacterized integral membrane protein
MIKSCITIAVLLCAASVPAPGWGQVFLASQPHPEFAIGPLFLVASVSPGQPNVTVNLSWSLTTGPVTSKTDIAQDLYLLWPAEIAEATAPGAADPQIVREVERRGLTVVSSGRLILRSRDRLQLGTAALGEPVSVAPSYVNFTRPAPQAGVVSYIKIPWTPSLADQLSIVTLSVPLRGLLAQTAGTWLEDLFWGPRQVVTVGFGDLGPPVLGLFALYYERRDRMIHLARDYSLVIANFADSDHLKIEAITPSSAVRRGSRLRAGGEVVALTLLPSQDIATQSLRVQYHYFTGRINWRPIVISAVILLATNLGGALMLSTEVGRRIRRRRRARRRFEAASSSGNGVPSRESLLNLIPVGTRYDEVVARFGRPDEEHERLTPPGRRTLLYRGGNGNEQHEVAIEIDDDRVREITRITSR